jgi:methionine synthase I (cobalamin-dependent)
LFLRGWIKSVPLERAALLGADILRDVANAFPDAGARVLITNTAAANAVAQSGPSSSGPVSNDEIAAMNHQAAAILRAAVSEHPTADALVFGTVGPTDQLLLLDEISEDRLHAAYSAQAEALAEGGADAILCQGFSEIRSLVVAVHAAAETTGLPVIGSLLFGFGAQQNETSLGVTAPQAAAELGQAGTAALGCESWENPDAAAATLAAFRRATDAPIWTRVNAGLPQLVNNEIVYPEKPDEFAARLPALAEAGATFVGGGRGAGVAHIAALAAAAKRIRDSR